MMTVKEKMYKKAHDKVAKLVSEGYNITAARTEVSATFGLSYNTVTSITRDIIPIRRKSYFNPTEE